MCYVQSHVRGWREDERVAAGAGFTTWPPAILGLGSGYCGGTVLAWRAILGEMGIATRQYNFSWALGRMVGHVCGEAFWGDRWHFFDVHNGTVWGSDRGLLGWDQIRLNPDEARMRISNAAWIRYSGFASWFAADPFAYLTIEPLGVEIVP